MAKFTLYFFFLVNVETPYCNVALLSGAEVLRLSEERAVDFAKHQHLEWGEQDTWKVYPESVFARSPLPCVIQPQIKANAGEGLG